MDELRPQGWALPRRALGYPLEESQDVLAAYWSRRAQDLDNRFGEIREIYGDTSVRGGHNEAMIVSLLAGATGGRSIVSRASVIDSSGHQSGELDVVVCNEDQTLLGGQDGRELLIVEGVDLVVQVKARLDRAEIRRIRDNCMSLKSLHTRFGPPTTTTGRAPLKDRIAS